MTERNDAGRFAAGRSGNPGGRPSALREVRDKIRARGQDLVDGLLEIAFDRGESSKNRIAATRELFDRGFGKATQPVDGDGEGGPVNLVVTWQAPRQLGA